MTVRVFPPGIEAARRTCSRSDSGFLAAYRRSASESNAARSVTVARLTAAAYDAPVETATQSLPAGSSRLRTAGDPGRARTLEVYEPARVASIASARVLG